MRIHTRLLFLSLAKLDCLKSFTSLILAPLWFCSLPIHLSIAQTPPLEASDYTWLTFHSQTFVLLCLRRMSRQQQPICHQGVLRGHVQARRPWTQAWEGRAPGRPGEHLQPASRPRWVTRGQSVNQWMTTMNQWMNWVNHCTISERDQVTKNKLGHLRNCVWFLPLLISRILLMATKKSRIVSWWR